MTATLYFDTETTGLPRRGEHYSAPGQPDLVQLALVLVDDATGRELMTFAALCEDARVIPLEAQAIHRKSPELCAKYGHASPYLARSWFNAFSMADRLVAHNAEYDQLVMSRHLWKCGNAQHSWSLLQCTMKQMTPLVAIPSKRGGGFKYASLSESLARIGQPPSTDAHDALGDVRAVILIDRWLRSFYGASVPNTGDNIPNDGALDETTGERS